MKHKLLIILRIVGIVCLIVSSFNEVKKYRELKNIYSKYDKIEIGMPLNKVQYILEGGNKSNYYGKIIIGKDNRDSLVYYLEYPFYYFGQSESMNFYFDSKTLKITKKMK